MTNANKKNTVRLSESQIVSLVSKVARRLLNEGSFNTEEWDRLDNELRKFGDDVTVSRFYSMGGKDICLEVGPKAQANRRAIKSFMESQGYEYYTTGGNGEYLMMDFKYAPDNTNTINMNENQIVRLVSEVATHLVTESILDDFCPMVEKGRYGEFWIKDTGSFLAFSVDAWISDGNVEVDVEPYRDDTRASQLCNSEDFRDACKSAILQTYPENIRGFEDFVSECGDYEGAVEYLESKVGAEAYTYDERNDRIRTNMANSGDFYSASHGY